MEGSVTGKDRVGGVVGYNYSGSIRNCSSGVTVKGESDVGGIAGKNLGTVAKCYNVAEVTGKDMVGGIVGSNTDGKIITVENCYNTGSIQCDDDGYCGGVVGKNGYYMYDYGEIVNCYNTGSVTGGVYAGGIVGQNVKTGNPKGEGADINAVVRNCFYLEGTAATGIGEDQTGGGSAAGARQSSCRTTRTISTVRSLRSCI